MIEIRIRHEDEADSIRLMDWDPTDLDAVIPLIGNWGLRLDDSGDLVPEGRLVGTFVVQDGEAFFEVMITTEEG